MGGRQGCKKGLCLLTIKPSATCSTLLSLHASTPPQGVHVRRTVVLRAAHRYISSDKKLLESPSSLFQRILQPMRCLLVRLDHRWTLQLTLAASNASCNPTLRLNPSVHTTALSRCTARQSVNHLELQPPAHPSASPCCIKASCNPPRCLGHRQAPELLKVAQLCEAEPVPCVRQVCGHVHVVGLRPLGRHQVLSQGEGAARSAL